MKTLFLHIFLFLFFQNYLAAELIKLTKEEQNFIKNNPEITVAMMDDFTPFSYLIENEVVGFEHDILKLITKKTGLKFRKSIDKWSAIYNDFRDKKVDMITSISYKKEREPFTSFTTSYYDIPIMVFVRDDFKGYDGINSLKGKKVGVLKDIFYSQELIDSGLVNLVPFKNYEELTKALVYGEIDALVEHLTNINYLIKKHVYTNLKLAGELTLPNINREDLRFGIQPEKPQLYSIIQKALDNISTNEKPGLINKWMGTIKEYDGGGHIILNEKEIAYLDTNKVTYCIDPNWMPFEGFDDKGAHIGMTADYFRLFSQIVPIEFQLVPTNSWSQTIEFAKQRKCDILSLVMPTKSRKEYLKFTNHYLETPLVIATQLNVPFINEITDLKGEIIGITKGYAYLEILKEKYPSLNIVEVDNIDDGLDKVSQGKIFAYVGTLASIGYKFQTKYYGELKIAGKISSTWKLGLGVRDDDPVLFSILQKAVKSISIEQQQEILNKWVSIQYEKGIDYQLVWQIIGISIILLLLFAYWNRKISLSNRLLKKAQSEIEDKNKELEKLAITDKLTNLYNRGKLDELLENEINRSERFDHTFGVCILDIDHFKEVNDTFGHQIGDKVLIEISNILKQYTRKTDYIGRYGGEEFLVICPESDEDGVIKLIESIRKHIEQYNFADIGNKTASFGITMYKKRDTVESLIKRADNALYMAKESGRNKVLTK